MIGPAESVFVEHGAHRGEVDQMAGGGDVDHAVGPVHQLPGAQPVSNRHRETQFCAVEDMRRHDRLERAAQGVLGGGAGDLLVERQPGGHREHLRVEEGNPQLQRVRHRHLVRLDQDVPAQPGEQVQVLHPCDRIPALGLGVDGRGHVRVGPGRIEVAQHRLKLLVGEASRVAVIALLERQ